MGHARYVGRVGALAVALGLGVAITNGPGIARAEPSSPSSADSSSTSAESPSSDPASTATVASPAASPSTVPASTDTATNTAPGSSTEPPAAVVQASGGANTSVTGTEPTSSPTPTATPTATPNPTPTAAPTPSAGGGSDGTPPSQGVAPTTDGPPAGKTSFVATVAAVSPQHVASTTVPAADPSPTVTAAPSVAMTGVQVRTAAVVAPVAPVAVNPPVTPGTIITSIVSSLLTAIGAENPFAANGPLDPARGPTLWTVLAFVRREIEQTLFHLWAPAAVQQLNALVVSSPNLLVNPDAELGDPSLSGYSSVTVPGWTVTGTPTVIEYGTLRRLPWPLATPGPTLPGCLGFPAPDGVGGAQFFGGGNVATSTLAQTVDLSAAASDIDSGTVPFALSGRLGGFLLDPSAASVTVDFLDANQLWLGTGQIGPVTLLDRWLQTGLLDRQATGTIPVGTRSARVVVTLTDCNPLPGHYNNAYADNLSFTVGAALPAPPPPTPPPSTVGDLDHVFMVYLENKGYTDIVGSPNAPYLNSIINAYGVGSNYYALTHPSDPNYYPILGGTDFGTNYNCPANCFDAPNLADTIEAAGKTWAGYMEGGGGYSSPTDRLPFLAFSDIYNDPARVAAHLFDLTELGAGLAVPATAPNFVWFAADDGTNMEGPTDTLDGVIRWALSQLTTHQYNVAAGDAWLQQTLPVILDSATWQDPSQRSAIVITFDEDYNNLSTGIGNQGNHIVTVVIPSQGAVNSGMRQGHFVATDHNNHYSLLRTIEDALGLAPLTNNDKYAQPMNEYWV